MGRQWQPLSLPPERKREKLSSVKSQAADVIHFAAMVLAEEGPHLDDGHAGQGLGTRGPRGRSPRLSSSSGCSPTLYDNQVVILGGATWEDLEDWGLAVSREVKIQALKAHPWHLAHKAAHLALT